MSTTIDILNQVKHMSTTIDILNRAKQEMAVRGKAFGCMIDYGGKCCMIGAVGLATNPTATNITAYAYAWEGSPALGCLMSATKSRNISELARYSDGSSLEIVLAKFDEAIAFAARMQL